MFRIFYAAMSVFRGLFYRFIFKVFRKKIIVGKNVRIGRNVYLSARNNGQIVIGDNSVIGSNCDISALNGGIIRIGENVGIGSSSRIISHNSISIGDSTLLAPNVSIYDHDHKFDSFGVKRTEYDVGCVEIGMNCWIGINSVILRGTQIGDNCLIAAGSIIKGNYKRGSKIYQKRTTEINSL